MINRLCSRLVFRFIVAMAVFYWGFSEVESISASIVPELTFVKSLAVGERQTDYLANQRISPLALPEIFG